LIGIPISIIGLITGIGNLIPYLSIDLTYLWIAVGFLMFGLGIAIPIITLSLVGGLNSYTEITRKCVKCGKGVPWDAKFCPYCKYELT